MEDLEAEIDDLSADNDTLTEENQELTKKFGKAISNNIKLSNYSWFNLGGPAEYFFKPENESLLRGLPPLLKL